MKGRASYLDQRCRGRPLCSERSRLPPLPLAPGSRLNLHYAGEVLGGERLILLDEQRTETSTRRLAESCRLTGREAEVLNWLAGGKTNRDIAEILGMSPRTVNKHLERVYVKLGVENRAAAVAIAVQTLGSPTAR